MPGRRSLIVLIAVLLIPVAVAGAKTHQDAAGDVEGPLDLIELGLDWNKETVKGRMTTAESFSPSLLEFDNGGSLWFSLTTGLNEYGYAYDYTVYISAYEGTIYAGLAEQPQDEDTTYVGEIDVKMKGDDTVVFEIPRSMLKGDKKKSKFRYWFRSVYSNQSVCEGVGLCEDIAPEGDEFYKGKF